MDVVLDQYLFGGYVDLFLVQVYVLGGVGDGQVDVGIVEYDQ